MPESQAPLPIERLHSDEAASLFGLFAASQEIKSAMERLEKRIKLIPDALEDLSTVHAKLDTLLQRLLETIPTEKLLALKRNMQHMAFRVYMVKPVSVPRDVSLIDVDDLTTIIRSAHDFRCIACDSDCNRCDLGKALDRTMVQTRKKNESWSYVDIDKEYDEKDVVL